MSNYIHQLFLNRQALRENDFVFPGQGRGGYLVEPRRQMAKVTEKTGITFSVHDMRRTYTSAIDGIVGYYELKRLLNHSARTDDVTAGYVVKNTEKLRPLMQKVTDHILTLVQQKEPGKVLPLSRPTAD
jgi:integrase